MEDQLIDLQLVVIIFEWIVTLNLIWFQQDKSLETLQFMGMTRHDKSFKIREGCIDVMVKVMLLVVFPVNMFAYGLAMYFNITAIIFINRYLPLTVFTLAFPLLVCKLRYQHFFEYERIKKQLYCTLLSTLLSFQLVFFVN